MGPSAAPHATTSGPNLKDSTLLGSKTGHCRESHGIDVLALARGEEQMMVNPKSDLLIEETDRLFVVGPDASLTDLEGKA